jgi:hypothetical protein
MSTRMANRLRSRLLPVRFLVLVVVVPMFVVGSGCSTCEAKCVGSLANITVDNNLAVVEVCDDDGFCTRQQFGPAQIRTVERSFVVSASAINDRVHLSIRGFLADGTQAVSGQAAAMLTAGTCGCHNPAFFFVSSSGVSARSS